MKFDEPVFDVNEFKEKLGSEAKVLSTFAVFMISLLKTVKAKNDDGFTNGEIQGWNNIYKMANGIDDDYLFPGKIPELIGSLIPEHNSFMTLAYESSCPEYIIDCIEKLYFTIPDTKNTFYNGIRAVYRNFAGGLAHQIPNYTIPTQKPIEIGIFNI